MLDTLQLQRFRCSHLVADNMGACENCQKSSVTDLKQCGGCLQVSYCSPGCQKKHWSSARWRCGLCNWRRPGFRGPSFPGPNLQDHLPSRNFPVVAAAAAGRRAFFEARNRALHCLAVLQPSHICCILREQMTQFV